MFCFIPFFNFDLKIYCVKIKFQSGKVASKAGPGGTGGGYRGGERKFGKYVPDPVNLQPRSEYLQPRSDLPTAPIRKPTAPIRTYVPIRLLNR